MIEQGSRLFEGLIIVIGDNPNKKCLFSLEERFSIIENTCRFSLDNINVVHVPHEYIVKIAKKLDCSYLLRGIRTGADYEYERAMRNVNSDISPEIQTVFLMPPRELAEVSSSFVKGMIGYDGWESEVAKLVPPVSFKALQQKQKESQR